LKKLYKKYIEKIDSKNSFHISGNMWNKFLVNTIKFIADYHLNEILKMIKASRRFRLYKFKIKFKNQCN